MSERVFITDMGHESVLVGDDGPLTIPRYGVWISPGRGCRAQCTETSSDLDELLARFGIKREDVIAIKPGWLGT